MTASKLSTALLLCLCGLGQAQAHTLTLSLDQFRVKGGKLMVELYDNQAAWNEGKGARDYRIAEVQGDSVQLVFDHLDAGHYAVKVFHDENGNGRLDSNFLGVPSEGYGFSNNAGRFGPASFEDAGFDLKADLGLNIHIR